MNPLHEVHDEAHMLALAESMAANGWVGAPLVCWDDNLLTGTHRYAAATRVLEWSDRDIPTISIYDVFAAEGLDWDAVVEEECPWWQRMTDLEDALNRLSAEGRATYGIDLN